MRRFDLFEFEDQSWLPSSLQLLITQALQRMNQSLGIYRGTIPLLRRVLAHGRRPHLIDLCSGAGGPWSYLHPALAAEVPDLELTFTDRAPQRDAVSRWAERAAGVRYHPEPIDAACVPPALDGVRTMFTGLHHFDPKRARLVLADAVRAGAPIAIFEFTRRRLRNVVLAALGGALGLPVVVPWLRPFRVSHLLWTYALPVASLVYAWDGAVSNLRTYRHDELLDMAHSVSEDYRWEVGDVVEPRSPAPISYLLGWP